jgi:hypothetical protein
MMTYHLDLSVDAKVNVCGQIGGSPGIPISTEWPRCRLCGTRLIAFLDIVLPDSGSSQFASRGRLQIFACRQHDDIAGTIYSDYAVFDAASRQRTLPREYWALSDGHYLLRLLSPSTETISSESESSLACQSIVASPSDNRSGFQLFGEPDWLQEEEVHDCFCGAPMRLLLQIPEGLGFAMSSEAKEQPNSFSTTEYCLFLGNQLYLFGCTRQCHPLALWPVLQN